MRNNQASLPMQKRSPLFCTLIVSIGGFLFGFDASVISGAIVYLDALYDLSSLNKGWIVSAPAFSAMFAMLGSGVLSDRIGRKKTLQIVAFCYVLSAFLSAISQNIGSLVAARMLGGMAFGGALIIVPVYISEISPTKQRGRLVSMQQMNIVIGFLTAYFSNYFIGVYLDQWVSEPNIWRWMLAVELLPALLFVILLPKIPESPVWLMSRAGLANPLKSMELEHSLLEENRSVSSSLLRSVMHHKKHVSLLCGSRWRPIFLVAIFLGILQQITGINAIFFYATSIFEKTGIGIDASLAQTVAVGVINIVFTLFAFLTIDRYGRRFLLLWGLVGMILSMSITAYGFANAKYVLTKEIIAKYEHQFEFDRPFQVFQELIGVNHTNEGAFKVELTRALNQISWIEKENVSDNDKLSIFRVLVLESKQFNSWMVLLGILGFVASFACSLGPVMWVILSEIFPTHLRGLGISIVGFLNSFTSWVTQLVFPIGLNIIGDGYTYAIFASIAAIGWWVIYRYLPETKGKNLEMLVK